MDVRADAEAGAMPGCAKLSVCAPRRGRAHRSGQLEGIVGRRDEAAPSTRAMEGAHAGEPHLLLVEYDTRAARSYSWRGADVGRMMDALASGVRGAPGRVDLERSARDTAGHAQSCD